MVVRVGTFRSWSICVNGRHHTSFENVLIFREKFLILRAMLSLTIQIPTRIPEKIVVALFSGILVNSGIRVEAGRLSSTQVVGKYV